MIQNVIQLYGKFTMGLLGQNMMTLVNKEWTGRIHSLVVKDKMLLDVLCFLSPI